MGSTSTRTTAEHLHRDALRLPPEELRRLAELLAAEVPTWSKPGSASKWAKVFGVGRALMTRWLRDGTVRALPMGNLWRIDARVLPPPRR